MNLRTKHQGKTFMICQSHNAVSKKVPGSKCMEPQNPVLTVETFPNDAVNHLKVMTTIEPCVSVPILIQCH